MKTLLTILTVILLFGIHHPEVSANFGQDLTESQDNVSQKVKDIFGKNSVMVKVAWCESRFKANAKNKYSSASGTFQIIKGTWKHYRCSGNVLNADDNIACAKKIYDKRGTKDWNASRKCWSK